RDGYVIINPADRTVWADPGTEEDVGDGTGDRINRRWGWRRHASWLLGKCMKTMHGGWAGPDVTESSAGKKQEIPMLKQDYFESPPFDPSRHVVFDADYWRPHWRQYIARSRLAHPERIFLQPPVFVQPLPLDDKDFCGRSVYSVHYYDDLTVSYNWFNVDALGLLHGKYSSVLGTLRVGERAIRNCLREQLGMLKADAHDIIGLVYATLIGERGVLFDMDLKRSYGLNGDSKHVGDHISPPRALDCSLNGANGTNMIN
ncbi:hypothetical protein BDV93DRAFT_587539, partial [Ceratobasidium sp. AG-I]